MMFFYIISDFPMYLSTQVSFDYTQFSYFNNIKAGSHSSQ